MKLWTVERDARPDEQGKVVIEELKETEAEALVEIAKRGDGWRTVPINVKQRGAA